MENREYIDGLSSIFAAYEQKELPFQKSSEDVKKLRKIYVQMCNGLNPRTKNKSNLQNVTTAIALKFFAATKKIEEQ